MQLAMPPGQETTARAFYFGILGMSEVEKPAVLAARGGAWFRAGGVELHLGVEENFTPSRKGHPGILVTALEEIVRASSLMASPLSGIATFPASAGCTHMTRSAIA